MVATARLIRLRYAATCIRCQTDLERASEAWWSVATRDVECLVCYRGAHEAPDDARNRAGERAASTAGASAMREFERRRDRRQEQIRGAHPTIGGLILALSNEPQSTIAWARGAEGERLLGARLDDCADASVIVLHDRRIPGSRANIDHLVVTSGLVFVIDAKRYAGEVRRRRVGSLFRREERLYVGRRDCTNLVAASNKQAHVVGNALVDEHPSIRVLPVLCFVGGDWGLFSCPFELDGVLVTWPKFLAEVVLKRAGRSADVANVIAARAAERFPPAA